MPCPPHHISSLAIDGNGWIIARKGEKAGREEDNAQGSIDLTPSCQRLLEETQLSLSCDVFGNSYVKGDDGNNNDTHAIPLEELSHRPKLANCLLRVIADIRRMGAPTERDHRRKEQQQGEHVNSGRRRGNRRHHGRVAIMEEQRKLRQENEQQKLEQSTLQSGQSQEDEEKEFPDDVEGFVGIGDASDPEIPAELRLAAVFNSLRVLIDITRPMLNHPQCQDATLKMKGPVIKRAPHRFYLISKHIYSCVSQGSWKEVKGEYSKLLDELQGGLAERMSKFNNDSQYELVAKDLVRTLFNYELFMNQELLANKCMELPKMNPESASKIHDALIDRFENDHGHSQHLLTASIVNLQNSLTSAICRMFSGARLTVYGSCLSGLALEGSHDVDVSIYIPELDGMKKSFDAGRVSAEEYEKRMRRIIFKVRDSLQYFRSDRFFDLFAITRARVPVIKGKMFTQNPYTEDGSLAFDLCFLNDIAVVNSSLLREYSLFHKNVRILMLSVKSFAKKCGLASAADGTLSSYSWLNLVVFYLQCIGLLPVLQCPIMMGEHGLQIDPNNPWHSINGLNTIYLTKDVVESRSIWKPSSRVDYENSASLLFGFFNFYACIFPEETVAASIRFGSITLQKTALHSTTRLWRLSVEDPFEVCDSHCPHDLGCHVKEDGQKRINESIARAKKEFETLLGMPLETTTHVNQQLGSDGILFSFLISWLGPSKSNTKNEAGTATIGAMNRNYLPKSAPTLGRAQNNSVHHQQADVNGRYVKKMQHQTYPRHNKRDGDAHKSHGTIHSATSSRPGSNGNDNNSLLTNDHPRHNKPGEKVPTRPERNGSDTKIDSNTDAKSTQTSLANQGAQNNRVHHQQAGVNGRYANKMQHQTYPRHNKRDGDAHKSHGTNHNATSSRPGSDGNDNNSLFTNDHPRHSKPGEKVPTRPERNGSDTKIDSNTDVKSTQTSLANQAASNAKFLANQNARLQLNTMENNRKSHSNQSKEGRAARER